MCDWKSKNNFIKEEPFSSIPSRNSDIRVMRLQFRVQLTDFRNLLKIKLSFYLIFSTKKEGFTICYTLLYRRSAKSKRNEQYTRSKPNAHPLTLLPQRLVWLLERVKTEIEEIKSYFLGNIYFYSRLSKLSKMSNVGIKFLKSTKILRPYFSCKILQFKNHFIAV